MSLLSFNLMATLVLLPLIVMDSLIENNLAYTPSHVDYAVGVAGQAVTTLVTTGSISAALVIAVDQYCAVMAPLHYHRRVTKMKAWLMLGAQWLFAALMAAFSVTDSAGKHFWRGCWSPSSPSDAAESIEYPSDEASNLSATLPSVERNLTEAVVEMAVGGEIWTQTFVSVSVLSYVVPLALLTWMYLRIYSAAHRNSQRTRRTSLTHSASEMVIHCLGNQSSSMNSSPLSGSLAQVASSASSSGGSFANTSTSLLLSSPSCHHQLSPMFGSDSILPSRTPSLRSTSSQIVHNLRYRISNASLFLYREEARAARVSVLVLVLVVCCWMPYHVLLALHGFAGWTNRLPSYAYHLTLVAVLINALSSPFLYAYRSRRIQREVRRLFGLPPKSRKGVHRRSLRCGDLSTRNGKRRTKTLRSLSPRRQLLRKQVRGTDVLSPEEIQAALSGSRFSSTVEEPASYSTDNSVAASSRPEMVRNLLAKVSRLWHSKAAEPGPSSSRLMINLTSSASTTPAVASELMAVTADVPRSSFSSAGSSSNSTSSAESDVSL